MPAKPIFDENQVVAKARDLFWERGYHATSIADLEETLGIRRSSLYNTFGGKRALYDRTLAQYQSENLARLRAHLHKTKDLHQALAELFIQTALAHEPKCVNGARGCYLVNATTEMANSCQDAFSFVANNRERFVAVIEEACSQSDQLPDEANHRELANYLFVVYSGLQVVVQTGIDRAQLRGAVLQALAALPWCA